MKNTTITITWVFFCILTLLGSGCGRTSFTAVQNLSALEANQIIKDNRGSASFVILDVRTPNEFMQGHIAGAFMLDYHHPNFKKRLQELDKSNAYLIYCTTGFRSSRTIKMIESMGFSTIYHLRYGIVEWYRQKLPLARS